MSDFDDFQTDNPETAPSGGGFLKYCLACGCIVALLAMVIGGVAVWKIKQMLITDPAAVEQNLQETVVSTVPSGYAGMFGMNMAGVKMSMIAPSGTMMGNNNVPLMIIAMQMPPGANAAQAKQQMQMQMNQGGMGGGSMAVEKEEAVTLTVRGAEVQAQESVGVQNGQKMRQVMLMIDKAADDPTPVMLMFMGTADTFDQAAMDAFLQSIK